VPVLYAGVLFLNALLLFWIWIQPFFAKMALPVLGGSPSVWTTWMLFFQAALLVGYPYKSGWWSAGGARHPQCRCAARQMPEEPGQTTSRTSGPSFA
jgi:hypothetical protein